MQLSLLDQTPQFNKEFFLDVFAEAIFEPRKNKYHLQTIDGQQTPPLLKISIPNKLISQFPEGTIYKLDTKLVRRNGQKPYFVAINRSGVSRAMEFFEYNLKVQNGFDYIPPTKR